MNFELNYEGSWNKVVFTDEQKEYIVKKYLTDKNASTVTIGNEFGVSYPLIRKVLNERGIESKSLSSFRKIYDIDDNFFEKIDTEEKAYWLGFLYADGYVIEKENTIRLNLSHIDKTHLEKFRDSLKSNHPIKDTYKKTEEKTYKLNYIGITNEKLCKDLVAKGCFQNKSLTLKFPHNTVPEDLMHHFIRGYFDGDGSISYTSRNGQYSNRRLYKISVIGTYDMMNNFLKYLNSNLKPRQEKNRNYYTICLGGNQQVKNIVNYLYNDATIYLDRKKQKTEEFLQYINENPYTAWNKGFKKVK